MSVSRSAAGLASVAVAALGVFGLQTSSFAAAPSAMHPTAKKDCPQYPPKPKKHKPAENGQNDQNGHNAGSEHVHGDGYKPCSDVDVDEESTPIFLGTLQADALGSVDATVGVTSGLAPGLHHMVLRGVSPTGAAKVVAVTFVVPGAAPVAAAAGPSVSLPRTGAEIAGISGLGVVLLGAGGMALYSGRRRRVTA